MEKSVVKIRKIAKGTLVVTLNAKLLEEAGFDPGDYVVIGAQHGKMVVRPLNTSNLDEDFEDGDEADAFDPTTINPNPDQNFQETVKAAGTRKAKS